VVEEIGFISMRKLTFVEGIENGQKTDGEIVLMSVVTEIYTVLKLYLKGKADFLEGEIRRK